METYNKISKIITKKIIAEMHRLLWIDPFYNKGKFDAGCPGGVRPSR